MTFDPTDTRLMVKTEIIQPSRPPVAVNYRMALNKAGEWKAYDVKIEGISMVATQRDDFTARITSSGVNGLNQYMKNIIDGFKFANTTVTP